MMLQPSYEPYSSVSFQSKQRTSPYPTDAHSRHNNPYPLLKSYDLGQPPSSLGFIPWRRKKILPKRLLITVLLGIILLVFTFRQWITLYWGFFRIKLDSTLFDGGYIPCGAIRKEPMLYIHDTQHVQVVWEMNCDMKDMTISWQPSSSSSSSSSEPQWESKVVEPTILDKRHALYKTVIGPLEATNYGYKIETTKRKRSIRQYKFTWSRRHNTTTTPIRIAAIADNQFGLTTFLQILRQLRSHQPNYLLHAGDAVQNYPSLVQWQTDFIAPLTYYGLGQKSPMIYAHGNHDHDPTYEYHYTRTATTGDPWHAFSLGDGAIRFIVLDSNLDWHQQDEWLKKELASDASRLASFRIVVVHIPPFLEYWDPEAWFQQHQNEWGSFVRERFVPLFEKYQVDLVISGHQHNYERGQRNQIHYAIIGGAGGDLDFDRVHDWGMYESSLLDFHFVIIDLVPEERGWRLDWNTFDKYGSKVDSQIIRSKPSLPISDDDEDPGTGAVDGDIIQDITLMDMDDQQQ